MATAALKGTLVRQSYACLAVKVASKDSISPYSVKCSYGSRGYALQEWTMSPHIVDCAVGALEVGVTAGAGVGAAEVNVKNRAWHWRTNVRRILMIATGNDWDKKQRRSDR